MFVSYDFDKRLGRWKVFITSLECISAFLVKYLRIRQIFMGQSSSLEK